MPDDGSLNRNMQHEMINISVMFDCNTFVFNVNDISLSQQHVNDYFVLQMMRLKDFSIIYNQHNIYNMS